MRGVSRSPPRRASGRLSRRWPSLTSEVVRETRRSSGASAMEALVAELRERRALVARRRRREGASSGTARAGKLTARERIDRLVDPGIGVPRAERARGVGAVRRRRAVGRDRHRDRRRRGPPVRDRRQRRDGQGRLVLPADREEAPARAGGGAPEPAAVPLPRRLRRRLPAAAGRGLPRPRPLRPDLLQPGAPVGARDPPDRGRDGLVHGRRRLRARHVGRDRDRARERGRSSSAARRS